MEIISIHKWCNKDVPSQITSAQIPSPALGTGRARQCCSVTTAWEESRQSCGLWRGAELSFSQVITEEGKGANTAHIVTTAIHGTEMLFIILEGFLVKVEHSKICKGLITIRLHTSVMFMRRSFSWQLFKTLQRQTWVWARARASEMLFELFTSLLLHREHVQYRNTGC